LTVHYVDASAWAKLLVDERESAGLVDTVVAGRERGDDFVSCHVLATELHRMAIRVGIDRGTVEAALDQVALILPDSATYRLAGLLPDPALRSLDPLHIASALDAEVDFFVSYHERQRTAATRAGLATMAPGSSSG